MHLDEGLQDGFSGGCFQKGGFKGGDGDVKMQAGQCFRVVARLCKEEGQLIGI